MNRYRPYLFLSVLLFSLASCGPALRFIDVDVKQPALRPLPLRQHTLAVFQACMGREPDSLFALQLAKGFKEQLEKDLQLEAESIPCFQHHLTPETASLLQDSVYLASLSYNTDAEWMFLIDSVSVGAFRGFAQDMETEDGVMALYYVFAPVTASLRLYDAAGKVVVADIPLRDTVYWEVSCAGDTLSVPQTAFTDLQRAFPVLGSDLAATFSSQWETQERVLYTYATGLWREALEYAGRFQWKEAQSLWMKCLKASDRRTYACACHNLALAAEIMGDLTLALDWLDQAKRNWYSSEIRNYEKVLRERRKKLEQLSDPGKGRVHLGPNSF